MSLGLGRAKLSPFVFWWNLKHAKLGRNSRISFNRAKSSTLVFQSKKQNQHFFICSKCLKTSRNATWREIKKNIWNLHANINRSFAFKNKILIRWKNIVQKNSLDNTIKNQMKVITMFLFENIPLIWKKIL